MTSTKWQRLVRFLPKPADATSAVRPLIGQPVEKDLDVGLAALQTSPVMVEVWSGKSVLDSASSPTGKVVELGKLLSPLASEEVGTIRCIGLNYLNHAKESGLEAPPVPTVFMKPDTALLDPAPAKVSIPKAYAKHDCADYEAELAVVIGKTAKDVTEENAFDYVLGYTAANDISCRVAQFEQSQWSYSKGFDSACPVGPAVVSANSVKDPSKLHIKGLLNGDEVQSSGLDDLIFSVPKLVSFLSTDTTLRPGTLILTGTPAGPGWMRNPRRTLKTGDEFHIHVTGGVGTLVSPIA